MAKAARVEVLIAKVEADNLVLAEVRLSPALSARVLRSKPAAGEEMAEAVQAVIAGPPKTASERVTVMIQERLAEDFAAVCKRERTTVSRRLGGRIRQHLDEERNPKRGYSRKPVPEEYRLEARTAEGKEGRAEPKLRQVQFSLSRAEAKGFDAFCRDHGTTKNGYVTGEMAHILHPQPKKAPAPKRARTEPGLDGAPGG